jgi:hypothetical protein
LDQFTFDELSRDMLPWSYAHTGALAIVRVRLAPEQARCPVFLILNEMQGIYGQTGNDLDTIQKFTQLLGTLANADH